MHEYNEAIDDDDEFLTLNAQIEPFDWTKMDKSTLPIFVNY